MSPRQRSFIDRLRTFEDVLQEVSTKFGQGYRFTPILDTNPPRVVSVAVVRMDLASRPKVVVPASDGDDLASGRGKAALRRKIGEAVHDLEVGQLSLNAS